MEIEPQKELKKGTEHANDGGGGREMATGGWWTHGAGIRCVLSLLEAVRLAVDSGPMPGQHLRVVSRDAAGQSWMLSRRRTMKKENVRNVALPSRTLILADPCCGGKRACGACRLRPGLIRTCEGEVWLRSMKLVHLLPLLRQPIALGDAPLLAMLLA